MTTRKATCNCGQLSVTTEGEPIRVGVCHCLACQKRTGSAFGVQARFPIEAASIEGRSSSYDRTGDDGGKATFHFCPDCGATVHYLIADQPELIAIPVGAFTDSSFPAPTYSVYEERRYPWVTLSGEIERID
jgi:hypothetical protein